MLSLSLVAYVLAISAFAGPEKPPPPAPLVPPALARVAVIGAEITDGFVPPLEADAISLADVIAATCTRPGAEPPLLRSSTLFFRDPVGYGRRYARSAAEHEPSMVVAIDFLFWFGYGFAADEGDRVRRLEKGLELLAPFECPLLVGTIPDLRVAATDEVELSATSTISPWQIPAAESLAKLNARIEEWAAARENVHLVPVAEFVRKARAGEELLLHRSRWADDELPGLLDGDRLPATLDGTVALTILMLHTLATADASFDAEGLVWDKIQLRERVLEARTRSQRPRDEKAEEGR